MALNWNLEKVKDYKELLEENGEFVGPYGTIILATMIVGMNQITEKNHEQFYERIHLVEKVNGTFFYMSREPIFITLEDISRLIGLRTNASNKTKAQFIKDLFYHSNL
jgi:hypothetical protein